MHCEMHCRTYSIKQRSMEPWHTHALWNIHGLWNIQHTLNLNCLTQLKLIIGNLQKRNHDIFPSLFGPGLLIKQIVGRLLAKQTTKQLLSDLSTSESTTLNSKPSTIYPKLPCCHRPSAQDSTSPATCISRPRRKHDVGKTKWLKLQAFPCDVQTIKTITQCLFKHRFLRRYESLPHFRHGRMSMPSSSSPEESDTMVYLPIGGGLPPPGGGGGGGGGIMAIVGNPQTYTANNKQNKQCHAMPGRIKQSSTNMKQHENCRTHPCGQMLAEPTTATQQCINGPMWFMCFEVETTNNNEQQQLLCSKTAG